MSAKKQYIIPIALAFVSMVICNSAFAQKAIQQVQEIYCYPAPNSEGISAKTTIGIRFDEQVKRSALQSSAFTVTGSSSGMHLGKISVALDGKTVIFTPEMFFACGEKIQVRVNPIPCLSGKNTAAYSMYFQTSSSFPGSLIAKRTAASAVALQTSTGQPWIAEGINSNDTLPHIFPAIHVLKSNNPSPGNIYLANFTDHNNDTGTYMMILDNQGNVLFERTAWPAYFTDFKPQPNGLLTYFNKNVGLKGTDFNYKYYGMDSNYVVVDSFEAANGYLTDDHELYFLPGGGYAIFAQIDQQIDMSKIVPGGDTSATVVSGLLQEFDSAKHLIFEWDSRQHFPYTDMTNQDSTFSFLDFTHCNSIENDGDTSFIISLRNLDVVTKISRKDGHVIWRLGGKNNNFTFVNDSLLFSRQHDARKLKNGNITMFDNGMFHPTPVHYSRAVEYQLDEKNKIATKVWEYHHNPEVYGYIMGNVQQLDNGNRMIGWGGCDSTTLTEITPDGSTALEMSFDHGEFSYRAFKYPKDHFKSAATVTPGDPTLTLGQNYPNPCIASSTIPFSISKRASIELTLYDELGRKIRTLFDGTVEAGSYSAKCDAADLPNGAYMYKLTTPSTSLSQIMFISK